MTLPISELLVLPDRNGGLELVDQLAAHAERGVAVTCTDGCHDGSFPDLEAADPVDNGLRLKQAVKDATGLTCGTGPMRAER